MMKLWLRGAILSACAAGLLGCALSPDEPAPPSVSDIVCSRLRIATGLGRSATWRQCEFDFFGDARSFPCAVVGEAVIGCDGEELLLRASDLTPVSRGDKWIMGWEEPAEASALRYIGLSDEARKFVLEQWGLTDWTRPGAVQFLEAEMRRLDYRLHDLSFSWHIASRVADLLLAAAVLTNDAPLIARAQDVADGYKLSLSIDDRQRECPERATALVLMEVNGIGFSVPSSKREAGYYPRYVGVKEPELIVMLDYWDSRAFTRSRTPVTGLSRLRLGERIRLVAANLMSVGSCSKEEFVSWLKRWK